MFEHEKLQVYQFARELNREICRLTRICSKGSYDHIDQLVRCGSSIARNIAEGCGEWLPKEKAKFYRYSKRSAGEAVAALDILVDYQMLREADTAPAKELLAKIIPMLVKLIQLFESGGPKTKARDEGQDENPIPRTSTSPVPNNRARARSP
jgi:four helix bundle protein